MPGAFRQADAPHTLILADGEILRGHLRATVKETDCARLVWLLTGELFGSNPIRGAECASSDVIRESLGVRFSTRNEYAHAIGKEPALAGAHQT